ncbi:unnamed protein product [Linum tenue]|uniref:Methyltransferase small domain-containing protein n=1 Tax=Linum tenue TaxID=586396 RepID=A0AAV0QQ59_9ROSI|nr:unnamed protein product [Linum tenue]
MEGIGWKTAQIRLVSSHPEVYEPCDDSFALVDALLADRTNLLLHRPAICLEVGCGSGYVITSLALMLRRQIPSSAAYFLATDINPHALSVTGETLAAHGVEAELLLADIASGLEDRLAGKVDLMVVNPPYVPTPEDEVGAPGIAAAWAGGENGRRVIDRILPAADRLLIVVQRSTEEENLQIIKFWRDADEESAASSPTTIAGRVIESLASHLPRLSSFRGTH